MAVPTTWRTKKQRYSLEGGKCPACSQAIFPPRKVCPYCGGAMEKRVHSSQSHLFGLSYQLPQTAAVTIAGDD